MADSSLSLRRMTACAVMGEASMTMGDSTGATSRSSAQTSSSGGSQATVGGSGAVPKMSDGGGEESGDENCAWRGGGDLGVCRPSSSSSSWPFFHTRVSYASSRARNTTTETDSSVPAEWEEYKG